MRISDWSSDVCSSDLVERGRTGRGSLDSGIAWRPLAVESSRSPTFSAHVNLSLTPRGYAAHMVGDRESVMSTQFFYRDGRPGPENKLSHVKAAKRSGSGTVGEHFPCSRCGGAGASEAWRYTG